MLRFSPLILATTSDGASVSERHSAPWQMHRRVTMLTHTIEAQVYRLGNAPSRHIACGAAMMSQWWCVSDSRLCGILAVVHKSRRTSFTQVVYIVLPGRDILRTSLLVQLEHAFAVGLGASVIMDDDEKLAWQMHAELNSVSRNRPRRARNTAEAPDGPGHSSAPHKDTPSKDKRGVPPESCHRQHVAALQVNWFALYRRACSSSHFRAIPRCRHQCALSGPTRDLSHGEHDPACLAEHVLP